jgi:hypothetical protein
MALGLGNPSEGVSPRENVEQNMGGIKRIVERLTQNPGLRILVCGFYAGCTEVQKRTRRRRANRRISNKEYRTPNATAGGVNFIIRTSLAACGAAEGG